MLCSGNAGGGVGELFLLRICEQKRGCAVHHEGIMCGEKKRLQRVAGIKLCNPIGGEGFASSLQVTRGVGVSTAKY